jgi:short-subunit dehydrogenase
LGATSTIARALAAEFAAHGYDLILAGRDREELEREASDLTLRHRTKAETKVFDVLDFENLQESLLGPLSEQGDALEGAVLCVGCLGNQTAAQSDLREARRILDTNFTSCVLALNIIANYFEKRRRGFICALSSVAGDRGRQSNYIYGAAKAGLTAYLQGLRNRLFPAGVRVSVDIDPYSFV